MLFRIIFGIVLLIDLVMRDDGNGLESFFYFGIPGSMLFGFAIIISMLFVVIDFVLILIAAFKGNLEVVKLDGVVSGVLVLVLLFQFFR